MKPTTKKTHASTTKPQATEHVMKPTTKNTHASSPKPVTPKAKLPMPDPLNIPTLQPASPQAPPAATPTVPAVSAASAPPTSPSPVVLSTTPPVLNLPVPPPGFVPQPLIDFRGFHAKTGQVAAVPDVVLELSDGTAYAATFGPAAPPAATLVSVLQNAAGWTAIRIALETYLLYAKTQEGLSWKGGMVVIDQIKSVYDVTATAKPQVAAEFPALTRLLGTTTAIAKKAAATRKRTKAAGVASATGAAAARTGAAAPATTATATTSPTPSK